MFDSLAKNKIVADKSFNRWMVPPAALMIHLSIGMIYGFSIFWPELTKLVGTECGADISFFERILVLTKFYKRKCSPVVEYIRQNSASATIICQYGGFV